jgi:molybdate transport system ATP-binding protein
MSFDIDVRRRLGGGHVGATFEAGEGLTVLFGPSGAGKTSTLNMIAGLLSPDWGHVRIDGETLFDASARIDVPVQRRRVGYVFQEPRLFPHKRVRANLLYGSHDARRGLPFDETIAFLGIGHLLDRWPRTLSGGEARRVAIGRALLANPRFLLLDEPLSSLDRPRREEVMRAIEHIRDRIRLPVLMVTHDPEEAERLGTRIVRL